MISLRVTRWPVIPPLPHSEEDAMPRFTQGPGTEGAEVSGRWEERGPVAAVLGTELASLWRPHGLDAHPATVHSPAW